MFIAVKGEEIIGHDWKRHGEFTIEVPDQDLYDITKMIYKFKYTLNSLRALTAGESAIREAESQALQALQREKQVAFRYLEETNWYVFRKIEQNINIPTEIKDLRDAAWLKLDKENDKK